MNQTENLAAFGMYSKKKDLDRALVQLDHGGFSKEDTTIITPDSTQAERIFDEKSENLKFDAMIGFSTGFIFFSLIGLALGLMESNNTQLDQTGLKSWILLSGLGAVVGLVFGIVSGINKEKRNLTTKNSVYLSDPRSRKIVLSVHLRDEAERDWANAILEESGAKIISQLNQSKFSN